MEGARVPSYGAEESHPGELPLHVEIKVYSQSLRFEASLLQQLAFPG